MKLVRQDTLSRVGTRTPGSGASRTKQLKPTLVLAESALETIPPAIWEHPAVQATARRKNRPPQEILLDNALHHSAMRTLPEHERRGRPDIVHVCLLLATASPLYRANLLNIIVHTRNDQLLIVNPNLQWRPPKNYNRFCGLLEHVLQQKQVPPEAEHPLLTLKAGTLGDIQGRLGRPILLFTEHGEFCDLAETILQLFTETRRAPMTLIVGAFPHGDFTPETLAIADQLLSIAKQPLEAWTVVSRIIYEIEKYLLK